MSRVTEKALVGTAAAGGEAMTDLKPCPWRESHGDLYLGLVNFGDGKWWRVECSCGAAGPAHLGKKDAIAAWNRRADGWVSVEEIRQEIHAELSDSPQAKWALSTEAGHFIYDSVNRAIERCLPLPAPSEAGDE